jgi:uncharacterized membrane protein
MRVFWVVFLLLAPSVLGATIHGIVYDFGLNQLSNAVVEINTSPNQQMVAKNGTYSFSVPPGQYSLSARHDKSDSEITENISALSDGDYVFDLILLPSIENEEALLNEEADVPFVEDVVQDRPVTHWLLWVVVFIVLGYIVYRVSKKPERIIEKEIIKEIKEVVVDDELQKVLEFVEKEGGRTTQKDIRKQFPYSEAKISLMIDELEAKGLLKRIKKGRGNVIVKA